MKKTSIILIAGILLSCENSNQSGNVNSKEDKLTENSGWERDEINSYALNLSHKSDTSIAKIEYVIATKESPLKKVTDSLILDYLDDKTNTVVTKSTFEKHARAFLDEYQKLTKGEKVFPWELNLSINFIPVDNRYVRADFSNYNYLGGAHGQSNYTTYMIDKSNQSVVYLEQICSNIPELEKRAEKYFRKNFDLKANDNLEEHSFWFKDNKFHLNRNFSFSKDTISFFFNQYEVAPYSTGIFEVEIPLSDVRDIVRIKKD